jgi:hypothetical protein
MITKNIDEYFNVIELEQSDIDYNGDLILQLENFLQLRQHQELICDVQELKSLKNFPKIWTGSIFLGGSSITSLEGWGRSVCKETYYVGMPRFIKSNILGIFQQLSPAIWPNFVQPRELIIDFEDYDSQTELIDDMDEVSERNKVRDIIIELTYNNADVHTAKDVLLANGLKDLARF